MAFPFSEDNRASSVELEQYVRSLSDTDLARTTHDGWTIAALIGHLAFWDQRMVTLLRRWTANGVGEAPVDADMINDAMQAVFRALDPRAVVEICVSSAAEIDAALEGMSPELYQQIQDSGVYFRFDRSLHRRGHLADIGQALGREWA
jgi:uncharacterized protein (TIGR03083 family)